MESIWLVCIAIIFVICIIYVYFTFHLEQFIGSINQILTYYCDDPPVLNSADYPWSQNFRDNWEAIRDEFTQYSEKYIVPAYSDLSPAASMNTPGWKAVFLRAFGVDTDLIDEFPLTRHLIDSCDCTTAYFSRLEPHTKIEPHYGIYKGVIRYHLGIVVPTEWEQCFLRIDGQQLHWTEGDDIMFDDLYEHSVENNTDHHRVVLFLDIQRKFNYPWLNWLNQWILQLIPRNPRLQSTITAANSQHRLTQ